MCMAYDGYWPKGLGSSFLLSDGLSHSIGPLEFGEPSIPLNLQGIQLTAANKERHPSMPYSVPFVCIHTNAKPPALVFVQMSLVRTYMVAAYSPRPLRQFKRRTPSSATTVKGGYSLVDKFVGREENGINETWEASVVVAIGSYV